MELTGLSRCVHAAWGAVALTLITAQPSTAAPFILTGSSSFVSLPVTGFPAGYAMATVFVNGMPSAGGVINVGTPPAAAPVTITDLHFQANGSFQFAFTNTPGSLFGVFATTNPAVAMSQWTPLGPVSEVSPGVFQFIDPQASNNPARFYRVRIP